MLLGHPGGPYFEGKDAGAWSIPKGQAEDGEELLAVAKREFGEETGHVVGSNARLIELGSVRQRGGKTVHAWAVEGDMDPAEAWSNTFRMEWPPRSGIFIDVPELDQVAWFTPGAGSRRHEPGTGRAHRDPPRAPRHLGPQSAAVGWPS